MWYIIFETLETDVISHLTVEERFSPDEPSTFQDCDSIPSAEQTEVSPNDQPISSTCTKESGENCFGHPFFTVMHMLNLMQTFINCLH